MIYHVKKVREEGLWGRQGSFFLKSVLLQGASPLPGKTKNEMRNSNLLCKSTCYIRFSGFGPFLMIIPVIGGSVLALPCGGLYAGCGKVDLYIAHRVLNRTVTSLGVINADDKSAALRGDIFDAFRLFAIIIVNLLGEHACGGKANSPGCRADEERAYARSGADTVIVITLVILNILRHRYDVPHQGGFSGKFAAGHFQIGRAGYLQFLHTIVRREGGSRGGQKCSAAG